MVPARGAKSRIARQYKSSTHESEDGPLGQEPAGCFVFWTILMQGKSETELSGESPRQRSIEPPSTAFFFKAPSEFDVRMQLAASTVPAKCKKSPKTAPRRSMRGSLHDGGKSAQLNRSRSANCEYTRPIARGAFCFSMAKDEICQRGKEMNAGDIARKLNGRKQPSGWVARCPAPRRP